jgi:hypothetical protein
MRTTTFALQFWLVVMDSGLIRVPRMPRNDTSGGFDAPVRGFSDPIELFAFEG